MATFQPKCHEIQNGSRDHYLKPLCKIWEACTEKTGVYGQRCELESG